MYDKPINPFPYVNRTLLEISEFNQVNLSHIL